MPTIHDTRFAVVDVETTGLDAQTDKIVQIAVCEVYQGRVALRYESLVHPLRPIPSRASGIHHITDQMVASAPTWDAVWPEIAEVLVVTDVLVAHNAGFDRGFLPKTGKPWLCTKRLAQHLWPEAPNHKNQTLRYWLSIDLSATAHDAAGDTLVTAHVLLREIEAYLAQGNRDDPMALIRWTDRPIRVARMPFGKHCGIELK